MIWKMHFKKFLEKGKLGEVTGGGTLQRQTGEIVSCDIEIHLNDDKQDSVNRLVELMNIIGIPLRFVFVVFLHPLLLPIFPFQEFLEVHLPNHVCAWVATVSA